MKRLLKKEVTDPYIRENFKRIEDGIAEEGIVRFGWKFFELTFDGAVTNFKHAHNLGFNPKDIIQTSKTGAGQITWNYDTFDKDNLDITTTGACVVRFLVGTYSESRDA